MGTVSAPDTPSQKNLVKTFVLIAAWLYSNHSALQWLFQSFKDASLLNLIIISFLSTILLVQLVRHRQRLLVSATPTLHFYPLLLMLGSGVSAIALQWLMDIPQIIVLLFALGTYGLCGLFINPSLWRKGLPAATLVACFLPFSTQFGSGLGFPVRVVTAHVVERMLTGWHIAAVSSHDIIVLENGIAQVDLPCSGLKSLWTGTLVLLAATWIESRKLGVRWLLVCLINIVLLSIANTTRVLLLVLLTEVWQQPQIAHVLHLPLGLIGFLCACALSWMLLQTVPQHSHPLIWQTAFRGRTLNPFQEQRWQTLEGVTHNGNGSDVQLPSREQKLRDVPKSSRQTPKMTGVLVVAIALALISQLKPAPVNPTAIASLQWSPQLVSEPLPLTKAEQNLFDDPTRAIAQKYRFERGNLSGSLLIVTSTAWHAHHPPELCFVGNGFKVDRVEPEQLTPEVRGRWLSLQNSTLSATYWFQSPQGTTDDFLSRIGDYIAHRQRIWVLVSVLFDTVRNPDSPEIQALVTTLHDTIDHSLNGI